MDPRRFTRLNLIGATTWVAVFMVLGYGLGGVEVVKDNLELTVLIIVIGTSLLLPLELARDWLHKLLTAKRSVAD